MDSPSGVLIVDDEALIAKYIQIMLEDEGVFVAGVAATGAEALRIAETVRPVMAILDVRLPDMDGIDLAHRIQLGRPIPVVFVSGTGDAETLERARLVPDSWFLQKPVDAGELTDLVRRTVEAA